MNAIGLSRKIFLLSGALLFLGAGLGHGQIINGGFESGTFASWSTTGTTAVTGTFSGQAPAEGSFQAVMTTPTGGTVFQASLETFLGLNAGTLDTLNGNSRPGFNGGSAIAQTFAVSAGAVIRFSWDFIPNGSTTSSTGGANQNDVVFFTLHLSSSSSSSFTTLDMTSNHPTGTPSGYLVFTSAPLAAGTYLLGFAAYDVAGNFGGGADAQDPTLLIDNVQVIPEPSTWFLLVAGGLTTFVFRRRLLV